MLDKDKSASKLKQNNFRNQPRSFLLWDGYGVLPTMSGTQHQQKKPAAGGEGGSEGAAASGPSDQSQRSAALCSLPANAVVNMVHECKVRVGC